MARSLAQFAPDTASSATPGSTAPAPTSDTRNVTAPSSSEGASGGEGKSEAAGDGATGDGETATKASSSDNTVNGTATEATAVERAASDAAPAESGAEQATQHEPAVAQGADELLAYTAPSRGTAPNTDTNTDTAREPVGAADGADKAGENALAAAPTDTHSVVTAGSAPPSAR